MPPWHVEKNEGLQRCGEPTRYLVWRRAASKPGRPIGYLMHYSFDEISFCFHYYELHRPKFVLSDGIWNITHVCRNVIDTNLKVENIDEFFTIISFYYNV